jgi:FkbM family methyltransferase
MDYRTIRVLGRIARVARQVGFGPLLAYSRDLMDFFFSHLHRPPLAMEIDGIRLFGYFRHRSFLEGISTNYYEIFSRKLFARKLKPGMIVIDAGAHIGLYSLIAARKMPGITKIFAFEPDLYNFRALTFNIARNKLTNIAPICKAVSNSVGEATFYRSSGTISSSLLERTDIGRYEKIRVQTTTIDHELDSAEIGSIILKLDIEGAEIKALQGMNETLERVKDIAMIIEMNQGALAKSKKSPKDLMDEIERLGFKIWFIDECGKRLIPIKDFTVMRKGNLFCMREI